MILKKVEGWPFAFGGEIHSGRLPPNAALPLPTPVEHELLDITIEEIDGGYLLIWAARPSMTYKALDAPKTGDSWHETIEDAELAAQEAFGVTSQHWTND
jgi:hypothetical protein